MGVLANVETSIKTHPWLWGIGGVTTVLAVYFILFSGSGSKSSNTPFSYSIGPSDASIAAATSAQNQRAADQTAVSLANIQATTEEKLGKMQDSSLYQSQEAYNNVAGQELALLNQLAGGGAEQQSNFDALTQLLSRIGFGG